MTRWARGSVWCPAPTEQFWLRAVHEGTVPSVGVLPSGQTTYSAVVAKPPSWMARARQPTCVAPRRFTRQCLVRTSASTERPLELLTGHPRELVLRSPKPIRGHGEDRLRFPPFFTDHLLELKDCSPERIRGSLFARPRPDTPVAPAPCLDAARRARHRSATSPLRSARASRRPVPVPSIRLRSVAVIPRARVRIYRGIAIETFRVSEADRATRRKTNHAFIIHRPSVDVPERVPHGFVLGTARFEALPVRRKVHPMSRNSSPRRPTRWRADDAERVHRPRPYAQQVVVAHVLLGA